MLSLGIALIGLGLFVLGLNPAVPHGVAMGLVFSAPFFWVAAYAMWDSKKARKALSNNRFSRRS